MKAFISIVLASVLVLSGCSAQERSSTIDQRQRENIAQKATSEFVQSTKPAPTKVVIPQGNGFDPIVIESAVESKTEAAAVAGESSDSEAAGTKEDSISWPLFIKLIGLAFGVALLAGVFWFVRRSSPAVNAAWNEANDFVVSKIKTLSALRGASTDPAKIQAYTEAERELTDLSAQILK